MVVSGRWLFKIEYLKSDPPHDCSARSWLQKGQGRGHIPIRPAIDISPCLPFG